MSTHTTKKGQLIPQTIENLQEIMAKDAVFIQELEGSIAAQKAKNNQLIQQKKSLKRRVGALEKENERLRERIRGDIAHGA